MPAGSADRRPERVKNGAQPDLRRRNHLPISPFEAEAGNGSAKQDPAFERGTNEMNFENYTERARGFVQAAQAVAIRANHQQLTPEHLLKALLEDEEGMAANLISAAGGNPQLA